MRTRPTEWFDVNRRQPQYGIKVYHPDHGWVNAGDGNGLFLFDSKQERDQKRKDLSKQTLPVEL